MNVPAYEEYRTNRKGVFVSGSRLARAQFVLPNRFVSFKRLPALESCSACENPVGCFFALFLRLLAKRFLQFVPDFMQLGNRFVKYRPLVRFRSKKIVLDRFSDQCLNAGTADFLLRSLNCQSFDIQQIFYTFQQLNVVRPVRPPFLFIGFS